MTENLEIDPNEPISGDPITDIKIRHRYLPDEIEFLKDEKFELIKGKTWSERLNDPEIQEFIELKRNHKRSE